MGDATGSSSRMVLVAVGAAALAAVGAYFLATALSTGDEPPIRVKRGSLELELLASSGAWEPQNEKPDRRRWKVDGYDRKSDDYLLYLAPKDPASCPLPAGNPNNDNQFAKKKIKHIALLYHLDSAPNEMHWVRFNAAGHKTRVNVESSKAFLAFKDKNEMLLELVEPGPPPDHEPVIATGYVKEIHLGRGNSADTLVCTFTGEDGLDSVLIAEEPVP